MKKTTVLLAFLFFIMQVVNAQVEITGTVTKADDGSPIPGASVQAVGVSGVGTITDVNGKYALDVPGNVESLRYSFVGLKDKVVAINGRTTMNVALESEDVGLDEVVVVAYGVQTKEASTGSVSNVNMESDEMASMQATSPEKMLQGRLPGVQINNSSGMPGSNTQIRIRGTSTINAGSTPLYVVDGIPIESGDYNMGLNDGAGNVLNTLDPNNIKSITILKDAAASSLYGSRASNGVVLIETKGGSEGETTFNASVQRGFSNRTNTDFRFMDPEENYNYMRDAVTNAGFDPDDPTGGGYYLPDTLLTGRLTDWEDEIFRQGINEKYRLSATGGSEKTQFFTAVSHQNTEGIQIGTYMKRTNLRANINHRANDRVNFGVKIQGAFVDQSDQMDGLAYGNPFWAASSLLPWHNVYTEDGDYNTNLPSNNNANPILYNDLNDRWNKQYKYSSNLFAEVELIDNLKFKTVNNIDFLTNESRDYRHPRSLEGEDVNGVLYSGMNKKLALTTSNTLSYDKVLNDLHTVGALFGFEATQSDYLWYSLSGEGTGELLPFISNVSANKNVDYYERSWSMLSYFGRLNYNFDDRYILSSSLRTDGSSRFGKNNRYATFWSVGGSWNLHNEAFLTGSPFINRLKLRGSFGTNGNDQIGLYESYGVYGSRTYNGTGGYAPDQLANPDLTWEESESWNMGVDVVLLNRLHASIEYYQKKTTDMLLYVPLSRVTGFSSQLLNIGEMENSGWEYDLRLQILKGNVNWEVTGNISFNNVDVLDMAGQEELAIDGSFWRRARLGEYFEEYYVFDWAGVHPATGVGLWYDEDGNITEDATQARRVFDGHIQPDFQGGFGTSFSWNGLSLSAMFNYRKGNSVYIMERRYTDSDGYNYGSIQSANLIPYWQEPGDVVPNPKPVAYNSSDSNAWGTSRFLEDGSFLRFKNLTLSYTLPKNLVESAYLKNVRIFGQASNLYTWHDVSYWDPERPIDGGGYALYPNPRSITFGLNVQF